jgi:FkbM family methyltransferase
MNATKSVRLGAERFDIAGVSRKDRYFRRLTSGSEREFVRLCRDFLRPDDVCLDIGANIGVTALIMSQRVPRGRVVAIEAGPTVAEVLRRNIEYSGKQNITVVESAVGDRDGTAAFLENSAWGYIADEGIEVSLTRLSSVATRLGLDRIDFIKIDVEGYEFRILKDALQLINHHRSLVYFELNGFTQMALGNANPREFVEWFLGNFAVVYAIRRAPYLTRLVDRFLGNVAAVCAMESTHPSYLMRITPAQAIDLIHMNLVEDICVTNVVATNAPDRIRALALAARCESR